ncbi:hypothetical protein JXA32_12465 [Candidatus Sumerlaeota bacterium]|nr:hypothetical protein [Candidatus Sumerlaeota bacterium]
MSQKTFLKLILVVIGLIVCAGLGEIIWKIHLKLREQRIARQAIEKLEGALPMHEDVRQALRNMREKRSPDGYDEVLESWLQSINYSDKHLKKSDIICLLGEPFSMTGDADGDYMTYGYGVNSDKVDGEYRNMTRVDITFRLNRETGEVSSCDVDYERTVRKVTTVF